MPTTSPGWTPLGLLPGGGSRSSSLPFPTLGLKFWETEMKTGGQESVGPYFLKTHCGELAPWSLPLGQHRWSDE